MIIKVYNNDVDKALRVLKKKLQKEGDLNDIRSPKFFVSKGEQKRVAKKIGIARWRKKQIKIEQKQIAAEQRHLNQVRKKAKQKAKQQHLN